MGKYLHLHAVTPGAKGMGRKGLRQATDELGAEGHTLHLSPCSQRTKLLGS